MRRVSLFLILILAIAANAQISRHIPADSTDNTWTGSNTFGGDVIAPYVKTIGAVQYAERYPGDDIGAKINAAYAALPNSGGRIRLLANTSCSDFSTPIVFGTSGKVAVLEGDGVTATCLNFTPTSGTAITVNTGQYVGSVLSHIDLRGAGGTSVGILAGGANGAFGLRVQNARVSGFAVGITFSSNAWDVAVTDSLFINNLQNLTWPQSITNSGEQITFQHVFFADNGTSNFADNIYIYGTSGTTIQFVACAFDQVQIHLTGNGTSVGTVTIIGSHFEVPNGGESRPFIKNENTNLYVGSGTDFLNDFGTVQTYPITASGGGQSVVSSVRVNGGNSHAIVGTLLSHYVSVIGNLSNPTNIPLKPYEQIDSNYAPVDVIGDMNYQNEFVTNQRFRFRSGTDSANNGAVVITGESNAGALRLYRYTGSGTTFYPFALKQGGLHQLDLCQGTTATSPDGFGAEAYTCFAHITDGGVGYFEGGIKAGSTGSTIADTRELVQSAHSCGTTTTCANSANSSNRIVFGTVALSSGTPSTAVVGSISPAFSSTSSFVCVVSNMTTQANPLKVANTSTSSITITGPNTVTDTVSYQCIGN